MAKPPPSGPHSDIDGLHRNASKGDTNRSREGGDSAASQMQDHHQSKAKPVQNEQKPGGNGP